MFLVESTPSRMSRQRPTFRTDSIVPLSGIYRVRHRKHRLPHEVTLLKEQLFPRCSKCQDGVVFELVRAVQAGTEITNNQSVRIYLYELPVFDEDQPIAI